MEQECTYLSDPIPFEIIPLLLVTVAGTHAGLAPFHSHQDNIATACTGDRVRFAFNAEMADVQTHQPRIQAMFETFTTRRRELGSSAGDGTGPITVSLER